MRLKFKPLLVLCLLIGTMLLVSGCTGTGDGYRSNDAAGYNICVKYDANGGVFTDNVEVIADFFNPNELTANADGNYEIALLSTDNELRGNSNYFTPKLKDHFLVGWYAERTETEDGYTYSKKWNFDTDKLSVPANAEYTATEPVMTLYAVWAPNISVEIIDLDTDEVLKTIFFNPNMEGDVIKTPQWSTKNGKVSMRDFPVKEGFTFNGAYYDKERTKPVDTEMVIHQSSLDESTGKVENPVTKIYVDYLEGEWFHIHSAKAFLEVLKNDLDANMIIMEDLDFQYKVGKVTKNYTWPSSVMTGNFTGTIIGNGHSFKNVVAEQANNSSMRNGLFGELQDDAKISDLTFENVILQMKTGTRMTGAYFGLIAGRISEKATISNVSASGTIEILLDANNFNENSYIIGLVSAGGNFAAIKNDGITCVDQTGNFNIDIDGNHVVVSKK